MTGENFPAERAESFGLVNRVVDDASLEEEALSLAGTIAGNAPLSMRGNKRVIEALMAGTGADPELERELIELREACFSSEDFREGIAAFAEKRKPRWQGR